MHFARVFCHYTDRGKIIDKISRQGETKYTVKESKEMRKEMDTIQFESRAELGELLRMIEKYMEQNPKEKDNQTVRQLYNYLDVMEMEW